MDKITAKKNKKERLKLKNLKRSIVMVRDSLESDKFRNEDSYPLDTFRYKPEVINEIIFEINDCLNLPRNEKR